MAASGISAIVPYAVNFSVVVVILAAAAKNPLRKYLYQRHERMKDAFDSARVALQKSESRHSAAKKAKASIADEEAALIAKEKEFAERERASILAKAREEAGRVSADVERLAKVEYEEASERVKSQFLDLVVREAEEALRRGLKKDDHIAIVKRAQNSIEVGV